MPSLLKVSKGRWALRIFLLTAVGTAIWAGGRFFDVRGFLKAVLLQVQALGPAGPLLFIAAYVLACVTFFPGVVLTLGAGILWGVLKGTLIVLTGATLGASVAFLVSRKLARGWILRRFANLPRLAAIDAATEKEGWKIVALIRLSPVFPFIAMNFIFGLTRIPFWQYAAATAIGLIPITMMFVYLGVLLGDVTQIGTRPIAQGSARWLFTGIGLVTTFIATFFITRFAQRALAAHLPKSEQPRG
jgi:uncharacterized membrane protein YdjX (TVP38/TMEM64 family)